MDNTKEFRCISFCTGYAGIELGLREVIPTLRTVCYVEVEAFAVANLVAKIEENKLDAAPIWTDIKTFDGQPFRDRIHLITAGYPCQPFSNAGKRQGTADPRHLWPYILEHIRTIRPVWCFFENVSGHLSLGFDEVFKSLRDLGYKVEAGLFTAAEVGAPHKRERLFILGYSPQCCSRRINGNNNRPQKQDRNRNEQFECRGRNQPVSQAKPSKAKGKTILAHTINGTGRQNTKRDGKAESLQGINRQAVCRGRLTGTSQQLADTECGRSPEDRQQCELWANSIRESSCNPGNCTTCQERQRRWPARPGQEQYDWEEPRTIKSSMGRTVDGFRSRVDELRLLGNGVVPQTAEKAFRELMALYE